MQENGLVASYLLDGKGGGETLDWSRIAAWQPDDGVLWVHLDRDSQRSRQWLQDESGLEPLIVESLLAAVYVDGGFARANEIVRDHWAEMIHERAGRPGQRDFKTRLQETLVAAGRTIEYAVTETGPQHAKQFEATVSSSGELLASGSGTSKKRAEQDAAQKALERLHET